MIWHPKHTRYAIIYGAIAIIAMIFWQAQVRADYGVYILLCTHIVITTHILQTYTIRKIAKHVIDRKQFVQENNNTPYYSAKFFLLINRQYIFPTILIIYITLLLIQQTQLRDLHNTLMYALLYGHNSNILLTATIASGIATIIQEDTQEKYKASHPS